MGKKKGNQTSGGRVLRERGGVAHPQWRTEQWQGTGDEVENSVRAGKDKVGRRMILESKANYLLPAATAGEWKLMDKRF